MNLAININGIEYKVSEYTKQNFIDMIVDGEHTVGDLRRATTELPLSIFNPTKGKDTEYLDEKVEAIISDDWDVLNELCNTHDEECAAAHLEFAGDTGSGLDYAIESYVGQYSNDREFTDQMAENCFSSEVLECGYFDWDGFCSDAMLDYSEVNGYYFRND